MRTAASTKSVLSIVLPSLLASQVACGGGAVSPTMQGREGMLSETAVAQKCEEAKKGHDRPFVVEWDATDLASFEAKAARDTIFVRYEGCKLIVLDRCSDPNAAGKLGAYGTPQFTSGTVQGFEIKNEGELFAKLPLGAASLSGRVQSGESLKLKYFVSGVAQNTRDSIYASDVKGNPGCAEATHYVHAYNLGAFELASEEKSSAEAEGSALGIGSAGGKRGHEESAVSSGGKLSSCETQDQRACRVPIRLVLREIEKGENPITAAPVSAAGPTAAAAPAPGGSAASNAEAILVEAHRKLDQGDGAGALELANKAMGLDSRLLGSRDFKTFRAEALMASGKCEEGKKDYRAVLAEADVKREITDFHLDRAAAKRVNELCTAATATIPRDYIVRAHREMKVAAGVKDGARCKALAMGVTDRMGKLDQSPKNPNFDLDGSAQSLGGNVYDPAAICVAESTKKCSEGLAVLKLQCKNVSVSGCEQAVETGWKMTLDRMKLSCK